MRIYTHQLFGFSLGAVDGEIGKIKDIYFDDQLWTVRYFVVETGKWLFKRKVLIAPQAVSLNDGIDSKILPVKLSKDQVKNSPDIDTDMPVSVQQESSLYNHYSWSAFGRAGMGYPTTGMLKSASSIVEKAEKQPEFDPHLRSFRHVSNYEVHNQHGRVGLVKDLLIELADWSLPYLLLDDIFTPDQERVMIQTNKIISIHWDTSQVNIALSKEELQIAPIINASGFFSDDSQKLQ